MTKRAHIIICALILICLATPPPAAQGSLILKSAREIVEAISKSFGKQGIREITEFGGETAVRELLEKAAREGGEDLVEKVAFYGRTHGIQALRIMRDSPARWTRALDALPPDLLRPALHAAAREPDVIAGLLARHGEKALAVAARHPGVGSVIARKLGSEGIDIAARLPTDDAIRLARYADDITALPPVDKKRVLDKIAQMPGRALAYLERHPKTLATAAGVATLVALKDEILGSPGEPVRNPDGTYTNTPPSHGVVERVTDRFTSRFYGPIAFVIILLGIGLFLWCGVRIWHSLKMSGIRQEAEKKTRL